MSFLSNFFGGGSQTVTQQLDPQTQKYVDFLRQQAQGYAAGRYPLPQEVQNAQGQYGQYANAGALGLGSLTGQNQAFMNPYLQFTNPLFDELRQKSLQAVGGAATQAGAYGGSRQGVAQGQAVSDIANQQAAYNVQGFNDAQQRALAAANLGFGAIGAGAFLPQQYASGQLGLLNQGIGPYGMTTTTTQHQSPFQTLVGLGTTAAGLYFGGGLGGLGGAANQAFGGAPAGEGYIGGAGPMDKMGYGFAGMGGGRSPWGGGWY